MSVCITLSVPLYCYFNNSYFTVFICSLSLIGVKIYFLEQLPKGKHKKDWGYDRCHMNENKLVPEYQAQVSKE